MAPGNPMAPDSEDADIEDADIVEGEILDPNEPQALWLALPEKQCSAHNRQGRQCRRPSIPGGNVCIYHGGKAPQVQAKAAERLAQVRDIALESLFEQIRDNAEYMDPKLLLDATVKLTDQVERLAGIDAANDTAEESTDRSTEQLREDLYARFDQLNERRLAREQAALAEIERQQLEREAAKQAATVDRTVERVQELEV